MYERLSAERKALQKQGRIPEWYLTGSWSMFKNKYLYQADDVRSQFRRIATTAAKHLIDVGISTVQEAQYKFMSLMWRGVLSPSTPVLANTGTERGLPVSCQGSYIGDSIDDIYKAKRELALHSKWGFGTSAYLGDIRPRGAAIKGGGKSEGVVPVFKGLVSDAQYVSQGNTRRGSIGCYLPITHRDVDELIEHIIANPEDANVGWNIHDSYIEACDRRESEALRLFRKTCSFKMQTGRGYDFFVDRANRLAPPAIKNSGVTIKASNLCVHGDTKILTKKGNLKISDLVGQKVDVWNGYEWSSVDIVQTGSNQKLLEVTTSAGHTLKCTPYHKFYVAKPLANTSVIREVRAHELSAGDNLAMTRYPADMVDHPYVQLHTNDQVTAIESVEGLHDTFCFTEPKYGLGVFNGILTGQCNEIALPSNELYSFVCVLSSINLVHWDTIKNSDDVFWALIFLDCINQEFIAHGEKIPGLERSVRFAKDFAALGLGVCGLHTLFQKKRIPFESLEAMFLNREIFEFLDKETRRASEWLANNKGCAKWAEGTGMRNATRMAIAPTKSTALLMGGVSEGINPDPAMTYTQASAGGDLLRVNNELLQLMRDRNAYKEAEFDEMNKRGGSIQHVDWLDEHEKLVFRNAFELNMEAHLRMAEQRQNYIDQGQSFNLFHPADEDPRWISHIRRLAFQSKNLKGVYYTYSTRAIKSAPRECVACQ
jgi:ribonucleotide reductase alpha subunit